jgi:hypothetical protein
MLREPRHREADFGDDLIHVGLGGQGVFDERHIDAVRERTLRNERVFALVIALPVAAVDEGERGRSALVREEETFLDRAREAPVFRTPG